MNESWAVLIHILFVTPVWCLTEIWTLHLKPAEPPQHCRHPKQRFSQCLTLLSLSVPLSAGSAGLNPEGFYILKRKRIISQLPCNPAMQVFTARSKNIQRDPEQVVLNKFMLSCSVCLVDGTKIRWVGQFRPGFPISVWQSNLIPRQWARWELK